MVSGVVWGGGGMGVGRAVGRERNLEGLEGLRRAR